MQSNIVLSQVPIEDLSEAISIRLQDDLKEFITAIARPQKEIELLTRKEACLLLGISLPTLKDWTNNGIITGYRIASRIRYKKSELETSLLKIKSTS